MTYDWILTKPEVYRTIFEAHRKDLVCFESYTDFDSHGEILRAQITDWV